MQRPLTAWAVLLALTALSVPLLIGAHLPAAFMVGPLLAAILVSVNGGRIAVSNRAFVLSEALIGCMIARALPLRMLTELVHHGVLFAGAIGAVLGVSCALSFLLMRWRVLPGTTAIWGCFPGAAMVMTLMAEACGEDVRLVAFMQYLRMVCVAVVASIVARLYTGTVPHAPLELWPPLHGPALAATLAVVLIGALIGSRARLPAGALLVPMIAATVLQDVGWLTIELPPALLAGSYVLIGWHIGARFNRDIVRHVARALPAVLLATLALIGLCAGIGFVLVALAGIDPLTAVLATSPGGADAVAIIAAGSPVDVPFVVAMQTARFVVLLVAGPALARYLAQRVNARRLR